MKKTNNLLTLLFALLFFSIQAQCVFEEKNGLLIIEAEDMELPADWHIKTTKTGYTGASYITWEGGDKFSTPGVGTITTKIKISKAGTYRFQWRNAVGEGTNTTEFNDSWLKFPDASDFYGQKGTDVTKRVYPKGSGKLPEPAGAGSNGWFKIYTGGTTNWNWNTNTSDNDSHQIYVEFDAPGTYTMLISGRSEKHAIDRISLSNGGAGATNDNTAATTCGGSTNPTTCADITLGAIANFTTLSVSGFSPAYVDNARNALAIDAAQYKDKFAAATTTFTGVTGNYNITIHTLSELDGESSYKVKVNGVQVGTFQNPSTTVDYSPASKTFNNIAVKNGDLIQVEFNSHTNGKIPENGGTAFSRGRWTSLAFKCASGDVVIGGPAGTVGTTPAGVKVDGELRRWHKVTLTCDGPTTSETAATNPFMDYRLDATFTHSSGKKVVVPGYYAACDNPAEGCDNGNKWKVHFAPALTGSWTYSLAFKTGTKVAINGGGTSAGFFDGKSGDFSVGESDKTGRDFRAATKGQLKYVGEHYLQFAGTGGDAPNGNFFIKVGADSPENFLAYNDFDNTPNRGGRRKTWQPHQQDYNAADASTLTWGSGNGTEILGVVNYLSNKGVNAFSFLTLSIHGDDENVFPHLMKVNETTYNGYNDAQQWSDGVYHDRFDVSKLAQWERVFEYGDQKGMFMHFKTMETENDNMMDGDNFGDERKIYYRELIARFSHHMAMNWNLTEESTLKDVVVQQTAAYLKATDPYSHHRVLHTYPGEQAQRYTPQLGANSELTGASVQTDKSKAHADVLNWVNKSAAAGKKWVVCNDEQGSANIGVDEDGKDDKIVRQQVLWGTLLAGGMGAEYYYGYQTNGTDLDVQDHRTRDLKYSQAAIAIQFFETYLLDQLTAMSNANGVTAATDDYVFAKTGALYVVYRPNGGTTAITLPTGTWSVQWFNPRSGGALTAKTSITNSLVAPDNNDWVAYVTNSGSVSTNQPPVVSFANPSPSQSFQEGDDLGVTVNASDTDGSIVNVKLYLNNVLVRQEAEAPYDWGTDNSQQTDALLLGLAKGSYTLKAVAEDNEGATTERTITIEVVEKGLLNLSVVNDAYLQGTTNFNTEDLRVEANNRVTYVMFDISTLTQGVERAELQMSVGTDAGNGTINVYQAANGWQETTINGTNKPAKLSNTPIATLNTAYALGSTYTFDVAMANFSGTQISFILEMEAGGNDVSFASKESNVAAGPKLVVKMNGVITAFDSEQEIEGLSLYPNPANEVVHLMGEEENWELLETTGKVVKTGKGNTIQINDLGAGMYFVKVKGNVLPFYKQ